MEELMIVANVAIVFGVIYKLFELFAGSPALKAIRQVFFNMAR